MSAPPEERVTRVTISCASCGAGMRLLPSRAKTRVGFCSRSCAMRWRGERARNAKSEQQRAEEFRLRFWGRVQKGAGCWLWLGALSKGYGHVSNGRGGVANAHRVAWELTNGPIPLGLWALHRCDNPRCVRPDHLFLGTQTDNMRDASQKGRMFRSGPSRRRGEQIHSARLTSEAAREIWLARHRDSVPQSILAERFGMSRPAINALCLGRTWRHVTADLVQP